MVASTTIERDCVERLYALAATGMMPGLERVEAAARCSGSPHLRLRAIQVAGTNGKGSICGMLEGALRKCGLKTGLFTSPHLHRFSERIRIDGEEVSLAELEEGLRPFLALVGPPQRMQLTFFEVATLAALRLFVAAKVDVAVLEVGLGGRLDATSIVPADVGVISSIGLDHTAILGTSHRAIAEEKAGICRFGMPVVCGRLSPEARQAVTTVVDRRGGSPVFAGDDFPLEETGPLAVPGRHMRENAAVAREAFRVFGQVSGTELSMDIFSDVVQQFSMPGRFELVGDRVLLDGAHNLEALTAFLDALAERRVLVCGIVFGALADKPIGNMIQVLRTLNAPIVLAPPPVSRGFDVRAVGRQYGIPWALTVEDGLAQMYRKAENRPGCILVTGSFFVVGEARRLLRNEHSDPPIGL